MKSTRDYDVLTNHSSKNKTQKLRKIKSKVSVEVRFNEQVLHRKEILKRKLVAFGLGQL